MFRLASMLLMTLLAPAISLSQQPRLNITGPHLLNTAWGSGPPFNACVPHHASLGCHATAFAQVLYFHQLAPHGIVQYTCTDGTAVSADFTNYQPEWEQFALDAQAATADAAKAQHAARFLYATATVIRKDFGTDQYVDYQNDHHQKAIETHFNCQVISREVPVTSTVGAAIKKLTRSFARIKAEIDARRPVGFYYTDDRGSGHAVVIDGYTLLAKRTYVHVNFGWSGRANGWYLLEEDLPPNTKRLALITIVPQPIKPPPSKASTPEPQTAPPNTTPTDATAPDADHPKAPRDALPQKQADTSAE